MRFTCLYALVFAAALAACEQAAPAPQETGLEAGPDAVPGGEEGIAGPQSLPSAATRSLDDLPRTIRVEEDYLIADITIDEAAFSKAPAIAMDIVDQCEMLIEAMTRDAKDYQAADPEYFRTYQLVVKWEVVAEAGDLMSLEGSVYTHSGGAHGNYYTDARIYNSLLGTRLMLADLFTDPEAAMAAQLPEVHKAVAWEKVARSHTSDAGQFGVFLSEAEELVEPSMVLEGEASLAASEQPDMIGGYVLHFAPYEIGSYAEGAYRITIPQEVFRDGLKPQYQPLFGGAPFHPDAEGGD